MLPVNLQANYFLLNESQRTWANTLIEFGQSHLFDTWEAPGINDDLKIRLMNQVEELNNNCAGGLQGYLTRAKVLLNDSRNGINPFDGWSPSTPAGIQLEPLSEEYNNFERKGLTEVGAVGFVLVAGGLGERLGYHDIKIGLPTQTVTNTSYLEFFCQEIKAIQTRYAAPNVLLPFAIMVSDDTEIKTIQLLESNNYFGLDKTQITILKQGKVPAIQSNDAEIALVDKYLIESKPHGHGDVHYLLHTSGTAQKWLDQGIKWMIFFQDTNGLGLFPLPSMIGIAKERNLDVNMLSVPRFAKQAVGAIVKLTHTNGREMTINVEYNQLDPLLRASISPEGDINDPKTGHSFFPGNINQLLFRLDAYVKIVNETQGLMPEFVNPKYKDTLKTIFKKPTRLECMMQDFCQLVSSQRVNYTLAPAWFCYSPCKNNSTDAAISIASGIPAASPYTAECDQYGINTRLLRQLGALIEEGKEQTILGITGIPSPRLIISPNCALFPCELKERFPNPSDIIISARSTLVIEGNVTVESLNLNGLATFKASSSSDSSLIVRKKDLIVNEGIELQILDTSSTSVVTPITTTSSEKKSSLPEFNTMRGYLLMKKEEFLVENKQNQIQIIE